MSKGKQEHYQSNFHVCTGWHKIFTSWVVDAKYLIFGWLAKSVKTIFLWSDRVVTTHILNHSDALKNYYYIVQKKDAGPRTRDPWS